MNQSPYYRGTLCFVGFLLPLAVLAPSAWAAAPEHLQSSADCAKELESLHFVSRAAGLPLLAEEKAGESARRFAECVEHPTDLGVLWVARTKVVVGTRVIRQHLSNLLAFYSGQQYWSKEAWDFLFGTTLFPTYQLKPAKTGNHTPGIFEPG
jgi:hypothetical protein